MSVKQERINQYSVFEKRMSTEFPASSLMIVDFMLTELCNRTCVFCPRAVDYPNLNLHMNIFIYVVNRQYCENNSNKSAT